MTSAVHDHTHYCLRSAPSASLVISSRSIENQRTMEKGGEVSTEYCIHTIWDTFVLIDRPRAANATDPTQCQWEKWSASCSATTVWYPWPHPDHANERSTTYSSCSTLATQLYCLFYHLGNWLGDFQCFHTTFDSTCNSGGTFCKLDIHS
jgi:hypothetical protein